MTSQDYYEILGVAEDADTRQIKEAYRRLAFEYHPDRNVNDAAAADKMKRVNEAYAVLSHPDKRRDYDRMRSRFGEAAPHRFRSSYTQQDIFSGSDIHSVFEEMARSFGFRGVDEIFREFYGSGCQQFEFRCRGMSVKGFACSGRRPGRSSRSSPGAAAAKGGIGRISRFIRDKIGFETSPQAGEDLYDVIHLSEAHAAAGGPYAYHHRVLDKKLVVKVPPHTREGQKIRLAGLGRPGRGGAPAGDLYLKVKIRRPLAARIKKWLKG